MCQNTLIWICWYLYEPVCIIVYIYFNYKIWLEPHYLIYAQVYHHLSTVSTVAKHSMLYYLFTWLDWIELFQCNSIYMVLKCKYIVASGNTVGNAWNAVLIERARWIGQKMEKFIIK